MVRLEALATLTRMAGRATWAMEVAMREARTREAAIATDGEEMKLVDGEKGEGLVEYANGGELDSLAWCGR